jgi:hypothetical protein
VFRLKPVSRLLRVTCAPEINAPDGSVTVPKIEPVTSACNNGEMKIDTTTTYPKNLTQPRPLTDTPYISRVVQTVFHSSGRPGGNTVSTSAWLTTVANTDRIVYPKTQARANVFNIFQPSLPNRRPALDPTGAQTSVLNMRLHDARSAGQFARSSVRLVRRVSQSEVVSEGREVRQRINTLCAIRVI